MQECWKCKTGHAASARSGCMQATTDRFALGIHPCNRIQPIGTLANVARYIDCDRAQGSASRDNYDYEIDESSTSLGIWNFEPNRYMIPQ
eukprot:scaffold1176_cov87-Skeletonema_dohrnii-CCMP3373.AAC.1